MNSVATGGASKFSKSGGTLRTAWTCASPVMHDRVAPACARRWRRARAAGRPRSRPSCRCRSPRRTASASVSVGAKRTWLASTFQRAVEPVEAVDQPGALLLAEDRRGRDRARPGSSRWAAAERRVHETWSERSGACRARGRAPGRPTRRAGTSACSGPTRLARARQRAVLPVGEVRGGAPLQRPSRAAGRAVEVEVGVVVPELVVVPGHQPRERRVGGLERRVDLVLGVPRAVVRERHRRFAAGACVREPPAGPAPS